MTDREPDYYLLAADCAGCGGPLSGLRGERQYGYSHTRDGDATTGGLHTAHPDDATVVATPVYMVPPGMWS